MHNFDHHFLDAHRGLSRSYRGIDGFTVIMQSEGESNFSTTIITSLIANVDVNDDKANEIAAQLANGIARKNPKLLDVIIALKEHLTSEDASDRRKAMFCLSSVLSKLPDNQLLKNEVSVVFSFYLSKMGDEALMKDTLHGISSLVKMKYISTADIDTILKALIDQYRSSSYLAPVRYFAFKIMENIYERYVVQLKKNEALADTFVTAFLHIVNGEKDPRNLLISFRLNMQISSTLGNVAKFKEELFDTLFCYFPITFKPPKNDPYKISNEDLKLALRLAMSSTPEFAEDAFGNLLDKLTASSPSVKNDTLLTLKACTDNFGGESSLKQWLPIWNALKFEIMHNSEGGDVPLTTIEGLATSSASEVSNYQLAQDLVRSLACELVNFDESAFDKFFSYIFEELKPNFTYEKDLKQSCNILAAIASANIITFNKVIGTSLPLFLENTSAIPKLKLIIMNLSFFFDAYISVFNVSDNTSTYEIPNNKLDDFKDEILMILSKALTGSSKVETTLRTLAVIQFTKMVKMNGYLSQEEVALIVQYLSETILTDTNKNIYCICLEGLKAIGEIYEDLVFEVSLKRMLELLPSSPTEVASLRDDEVVEKENVLKVILDFTTSKHRLIKESLFGLSAKLCVVASHEGSEEYCFLLISSLYTLLANNINLIEESDAALIKEKLELQLLRVMEESSAVRMDDHNLTLISNVLFFINLKTNKTTHQDDLERYKKYFIEDLKVLEKPDRNMVPFVKLICALNKECQFEDAGNLLDITVKMLKENVTFISEFERLGYLEFAMVLSNKWLAEHNLNEFCDWEDLSCINLETIVWIGKGLVMKSSPLAVTFCENLLAILSNKNVGSYVANLFEIFVIDITSLDKYKGIPWSNNTKLLYKQKFFCQIFRTLVQSYKTCPELSVKSNYLAALSLVLKHIPTNIVEPYMDEMLPLMLQALDMPISEVKVSALNTLKDTSEKFRQLITEHIQTLVSVLLKLVLLDKYNDVSVRLLSLELLETLTNVVPLNYMLVYKKDITSGLEPVLDDKKRVVRKQCVKTRQAYFELGQVPFE